MRSLRATVILAALVVVLTSACRRRNDDAAPAPQPSPSGTPDPMPLQPLPPLTATDGNIALGNLDAQMDQFEKRLVDPDARIALISLLLTRGDVVGRIADYERSASLAEDLVRERPKDPACRFARASTFSIFHRFDDALADLVEAEKNGGAAERLSAARSSIYAAMGKYDEALAARPLDEARMTTLDLAGTALLLGDEGNDDEASRLLTAARAKYANSSPFPLAWMDFEEGGLLERHGKLVAAKGHYQRALTLIPRYARAAAHLAALSRPIDAIAILEPITTTSDDPEILVQLADALRRSGREDEAKQRLAAAITRYDELVEKHPAAFADHAAMMWLGEGRDPRRALTLAKVNLDTRKTPEAYSLFITAALAAKDESGLCPVARQAMALKYSTDSLRALAAPVASRCPS